MGRMLRSGTSLPRYKLYLKTGCLIDPDFSHNKNIPFQLRTEGK